MANNRMYLRCRCGGEFYLFKYYPSTGWYRPVTGGGDPTQATAAEAIQGGIAFLDQLAAFMDAHATCEGTDAMWGDAFHLGYEQVTEARRTGNG